MKKIILPILFIGIIAFAFSCHHSKNTSTTNANRPAGDTAVRHYTTKAVKNPVEVDLGNGLKYTVLSQGSGPLPKKGEKIYVIYTGRFTNDTVFDASSKAGFNPLPFHVGQREVIAGWDSVFSHLHGGDIATMTIPPQYGYGAMARGAIPANSTLKFDVEVINIVARPMPWDAKGKDTITTKSGLKIVMFETHPEAPLPTIGKNVSVHYSGFLLDGSIFDSSVERGAPFSFQLGMGHVIKGWDEGIALLHKGEKAKLIIPFELAYGAQGRPPVIPPKATLIFDVQLVNF